MANCLLFDTPPVGVFELPARSMEDSLLGKVEAAGQTFKLGRARFTESAIKAAYKLLKREYPQVSSGPIPA